MTRRPLSEEEKELKKIENRIRSKGKFWRWRDACKERDHSTCQDCGINEEEIEKDKPKIPQKPTAKFWKKYTKYWITHNIHVHHKKPIHEIIIENNLKTHKYFNECKELWNLNNGVTLCQNCHRKKHKIRNGKNAKMP